MTELGLDAERLNAALESGEHLQKVRADVDGGVRSGVNGTPTFFVNGVRYDGPRDFETMAEMLDRAVRAKRKSK